MTKVEILRAITSKKPEFTQGEAESILNAFEEVIKESLAADKSEKIQFGKLGKFEAKHVGERSGEMNGVAWTKPAHDSLVFKPSSAMKDI